MSYSLCWQWLQCLLQTLFGEKNAYFFQSQTRTNHPPRNNNPWAMDNNCVKYHCHPSCPWKVIAGQMTHPWVHGQQLCKVSSESKLPLKGIWPGTIFCHLWTVALTLAIWPWVKFMKQLCEISRSNMDFAYARSVTLTLDIWSWITPWVIDTLTKTNMVVRSFNPDTAFGYVCTVTLTLEICHDIIVPWTTIVWNIIEIQHCIKVACTSGQKCSYYLVNYFQRNFEHILMNLR